MAKYPRRLTFPVILSLLLAACTSGAPTGSPTPPGTAGPTGTGVAATTPAGACGPITFVGFTGAQAGNEERAGAFMKSHPCIQVTVETVPANSWGEFLQAVSINIAGGHIPDIADVATEGQRQFAQSGVIIPLDDYIARDASYKADIADLNPRLLDATKVDGKQIGLPTVWNNVLIYYNKKVLQSAGLQPPSSTWTLDDFIRMSQQVVASGGGRWGFVINGGYFDTITPWMLLNGTNILSDDLTQSRLSEPSALAAWQLLYDFIYKYKIAPKLEAGVSDATLFAQNKLAFMAAGMWQINSLKQAGLPIDDWDIAPMPTWKTNTEVIGVGAAPIFTASQQKDAAWEFAKALSSTSFQSTVIVADRWSIPSSTSAFQALLTTPYFPKSGQFFWDALANSVLVQAPKQYGAVEAAVVRELSAALAGSKSVQDAIAAADAGAKAALAQP